MPHIHGTWGHYVRPGKTDPVKYGSYHTYHAADDACMADTPEERRATAKKAAKKARRARRKAARKAVEMAAQKDQPGIAASKVPTSKQAMLPPSAQSDLPEVSLSIRDTHGVEVYNCGSKKGARIRAFLVSALPKGSFVEASSTTITLKRTIKELGFKSSDGFKYWCAHKGKRRQ